MSKCEICGAKPGAPVRLPAGDTVPRHLLQCPGCKTVMCNGCIRIGPDESVGESRRSLNPLRLFAGLKHGAQTAVAQATCTICGAALDMEANRI